MLSEHVEGAPSVYIPSPAKKIACGFYHSAAVYSGTENEPAPLQAYAWGRNKVGACGPTKRRTLKAKDDDSAEEVFYIPTKVQGVSEAQGQIFEVACGSNHTAFLFKQPNARGGQLWAAGLGTRGRLGRADPEQETSGPEEVDGVEEVWWTKDGPIMPIFNGLAPEVSVLRVCCGADHTLCITTDGRIWAWGANTEGQCGVGSTTDVTNPQVVSLETSITHLAAGAQHSLAVVRGDMWAWGCSRNGRLGLGARENVTTPTLVPCESAGNITFVAGGEAHSAAVDSEGKVLTWGAGSYGRLGHGDEMDLLVPKVLSYFDEIETDLVMIKSIALGGFHSLFLEQSRDKRSAPRLYVCGYGAAVGQLSPGDRSSITVPRVFMDCKVFNKSDIVQIACGMYHSMVLLETGEIAVWGVGAHGRLGLAEGKVKNVYEPAALRWSYFRGFVSSEGGALDPSERLARRAYRAARGNSQGDKSKNSLEVKQIALGAVHSTVLTNKGRLYVFGCNADGQLGSPVSGSSSAGMYQWVPRELKLGGMILEVAAGYDHCLALTASREVYAWGKGLSGQLGTGYSRSEDTPRRIESLTQAQSIAAGEELSAAIVRADSRTYQLYTWGSAESGMLGLGGGHISGTMCKPALVTFPPVKDSSAAAGRRGGAARTPALKDAHQAGDSSADVVIGPVQVRCGQSHTAVIVGPIDQYGNALANAGVGGNPASVVFTFGSGWYGKLGLNGDKNAYAPTQVHGLTGVSARTLSLGANHSAMISVDNDLYLWGHCRMCCEPMGAEHVTAPKKFIHIDGQPKVRSVACGETHTLAVTAAGELWVWGENKSGQLGLGLQGQPELTTPEEAKLSQGAVELLAAGPKHTIAKFTNGEVYAWGCQSCGRLGLEDKQQDRICWNPEKVMASWVSPDSTGKEAAPVREESDSEASNAAGDVAKADPTAVTQQSAKVDTTVLAKGLSFATMQLRIKQEDKHSREEALQKMQQKLEAKFTDVINSVKAMAAKESQFEVIMADIEQSVKKNLRYFPKVNPLPAGESKTDARIVAVFPAYCELFWLLQQQVGYLAQLSTCITSSTEVEMFYRIVFCIFGEKHPRVKNLFLMLLRIIIDKETEVSGQKIETVFSAASSKFFHMFSRFALSPTYYRDVVHPFLKQRGKSEEETLLLRVKGTSDRSEIFAFSLKEFRALADSSKDPQELQLEYQNNVDRFREFMTGEFLTAIKQVNLPLELRQLLGHALQAVSIRQFHVSAADTTIPQELRACVPLLRLFCDGILRPLLTNATKYASKEAFLRATGEQVLKGDTVLASNLQAIARFLDHMNNNTFDGREHKILMLAAKVVKPEMLKYLLQQADVVSNIEVQLTMDAYMYHFERIRHYVHVSTSDCLRLSNMLRKYMNKLRIKESDALEATCSGIPQWEPELIESAKGDDMIHNFQIQTRFLLYTELSDVLICRTTRCPMPRRLVGQQLCDGLIQSFQTAEDGDNPRKFLETLFHELEPLKSNTFQEMRVEFAEYRDFYRDKSPPNYEMVQFLVEGLRNIDELINVESHPEDVLSFMSNSLAKRAQFRQYLLQLEGGLTEIKRKQHEYEQVLAQTIKEFKQMHSFSLDLKLPKTLESRVQAPVSLKFSTVARQLEAKRAFSLNPKTMQELNCSILPMETRSMNELRRMNVIVEVHPQFAVMERRMRVTFRALPKGGVELVVGVVQQGGSGLFSRKDANMNAVKKLIVTEEQLTEMRRAQKDEQTALAPPGEEAFLTCVSSKFCDLITALSRKAA